jgi:hypothetical protein
VVDICLSGRFPGGGDTAPSFARLFVIVRYKPRLTLTIPIKAFVRGWKNHDMKMIKLNRRMGVFEIRDVAMIA